MEERFELLVQGSSADPYHVVFTKWGERFTATCTCAAGAIGDKCKHRLNVLTGEKLDIVQGKEHIERIKALLPGSSVEQALDAIKQAETQVKAAKKALTLRKQELAWALSGEIN